MIYGGGTWIDTPSLGGVLFIAKMGRGNVWYENSDLHAQSGAYEWIVYDPRDLAAVAGGKKKQWQIQPKNEWTDDTLPLAEEDRKGWSGVGVGQVNGATFDPKAGCLYVLATGVWKGEVESYPVLYVYRVGPARKGPTP